ncbi:MAG: hypothetical protein JNL96_04485 [Planctomycetaceae bacterium]|nr:hypothetical protein [Planctomycetaceae bacterium]
MSDREFVGLPVTREVLGLGFSRVGGLPAGMSAERWPQCLGCGRHLDFYFALDLQWPRTLAHRFRFAYFFFCNGYVDNFNNRQCSTFYPYPEEMANRIVLLEELDGGSAMEYLGPHPWPEYAVQFLDAETLADYKAELSQQFADAFLAPKFNDQGLVEIQLPKESAELMHLRREPEWIQDDETPICPKCGGPTKFLAQFDSTFDCEKSGHFPYGVAYAFLCRDECSPEGSYLMFQVG